MKHLGLQIALALGGLELLAAPQAHAQAADPKKPLAAEAAKPTVPVQPAAAAKPAVPVQPAAAATPAVPAPAPAATPAGPAQPADPAKVPDAPAIAQDLHDQDPGVRATANLRQVYTELEDTSSQLKAADIAAELKAAPKPGPRRAKALKNLSTLTKKTTAVVAAAPPGVKRALTPAAKKAAKETEAAVTPAPPPAPATGGDITFQNGSNLRYGPTVSLLRYQTSRRSDEPGRLRDYTPALALLPAQFGFQFVYRPAETPWRLPLPSHKWYQLLSAGGMLLAHVDTGDASRGSLSLAATLGLFEDSIGLGVGFDLYRGIPVRGADGKAGSSTVYTGLLAPAFAREGELTPENAFVVITLNLAWLTKTVAGEL